jgi:hypothetical protein
VCNGSIVAANLSAGRTRSARPSDTATKAAGTCNVSFFSGIKGRAGLNRARFREWVDDNEEWTESSLVSMANASAERG